MDPTEINDLAKQDSNNLKNNYTEESIDKLQLIASDDEDKEDYDDVPGDFFDDFLKEDFMAGLDIVDDDDWDEEKANKKRNKDLMKNDQKKRTEKNDNTNRYRRINRGKEKNKSTEKVNLNSSDICRDPMKTKRDIERDKERYEKFQEKKIISEKLQLVETGLVPPGMEMEFDIETVKLQTHQAPEDTSAPKKSDPVKKKSPNSDANKISRRPRSKSPRRRSRSLRRRSRSPLKRARSPRRRSRTTTALGRRSPIRRRSADRLNRRHLERHSRSRSKSRRIRRSRSRLDKKKRDAKRSFLQEIVEKLNETPRNVVPPYQNVPSAGIYHVSNTVQVLQPVPPPMPVAVPALSTQYPLQPRYDRYDQNFYIGNSQPEIPQPDHLPVAYPLEQFTPQVMTATDFNAPSSINANPAVSHEEGMAQDGINKLFQNKKISLTDFLSITAKSEAYSSGSDHLKEKINVISRCQDAINYLGNSEKLFSGPLIIKPNNQKVKTPQEKYQSPLMKYSQVTFPYTDIPKKSLQKTTFTEHIDRLLNDLGLDEDVIIIEDSNETVQPAALPPPPPVISNSNYVHQETTRPIKFSKFAQTDFSTCKACEQRNTIQTKSVGIQCGGNDGVSFNAATQVSENDFYVKIQKPQSLAALTPAQLLGKVSQGSTKSIDINEFDIFPPKHSTRSSYNSAYSSMESYGHPNVYTRGFDPDGPGGGSNRPINNNSRYNYYK